MQKTPFRPAFAKPHTIFCQAARGNIILNDFSPSSIGRRAVGQVANLSY
jgi:hypothetical protein